MRERILLVKNEKVQKKRAREGLHGEVEHRGMLFAREPASEILYRSHQLLNLGFIFCLASGLLGRARRNAHALPSQGQKELGRVGG